MMHLEGSCHCRAVRFRVESPHPYPFNLCYCSICRKTAGAGGYAICIGALAATLEVEGHEHVTVYRAWLSDPAGAHVETSPGERRFCSRCGSALWVWDPRWPDLVHPFASAIDTPLPDPPQRTHIMLGSKASWVKVCAAPGDLQFPEFPEESLAAWHERHGLVDE